jgi:hypothetical protein
VPYELEPLDAVDVAMSDIDSSLVDVERTGSTSGLRSEDAGPLLGLAAAAEEKQRKTALGACHVVTVTPPILRQPNPPELRASAFARAAPKQRAASVGICASSPQKSTVSKFRGDKVPDYGTLV